jgi:chemotaxis signal transduction protein
MMDAPLDPPITPDFPPVDAPAGEFQTLLEQLLDVDAAAPVDGAGEAGLGDELWAHVLSSSADALAAPPADAGTDMLGSALADLDAELQGPADEPERAPEPVALTPHVLFRLGRRACAVPLAAVSEIGRPPRVTRLPHVPAWMLGIANLRGDIVSVLDLEGFFTGRLSVPTAQQRVLVLRPTADEVRSAVLVDSVDGIQPIDETRLADVPEGLGPDVAPFARGLYEHEGELFVLVDPDRVLHSPPMRQFEDPAAAL